MIIDIANSNNLVSVQQLSELAGVHRTRIIRKKGIEEYYAKEIPNPNGTGRPIKLYSIDCLILFGTPEEVEQLKSKHIRKRRCDLGAPRKGITPEMESQFIALTKAEFLANAARRDVLGACFRTAKELWSDVWSAIFVSIDELSNYYYKTRIMRNDFAKNQRTDDSDRKCKPGDFVGAYHKERWEDEWERRWKRKDTALITVPTARYNYLELGESLGLIEPGRGAATVFWLDDHVGDSFIRDDDKKSYKGSLPKGLYMIDGWSGRMLDYMAGEVTTTMTALMIIRQALKFGLPAIIGLENSRVMKSVRIDRIIEALYPDDLLAQYKNEASNYWLRTMFMQSGSPIVRNVPNNPRFPFKAGLEAKFKNIKLHDALNFPRTYQGGGLDPVQLHLNSTPVTPGRLYTQDIYTLSVTKYLNSEYLEKNRPGMFPGFREKTGIIPSIENVWGYYGGNQNAGTGIMPDAGKIGLVLYWLASEEESPALRKTVVKAQSGRVNCTINGIPCWFVDESLAGLRGEKVAIVTIPESLNAALGMRSVRGMKGCDYAALFHIVRKEPRFLGFVKNTYTTDYRELQENRAIITEVRRQMLHPAPDAELHDNIKKIEHRRVERLSAINDEVIIPEEIPAHEPEPIPQAAKRFDDIERLINL